MSQTTQKDLMTRLKEETRSLHDATENHGFMAKLMDGSLQRDEFIASVGLTYLLYREVENRLRKLRESSPRAAAVLRDYHFLMTEYSRRDLEYFRIDQAQLASNEGIEFFVKHMDTWMAKDPDAALGMFYVLEGSHNGAKILKRRLQELFHLEGDNGLLHQDPHGGELRTRWMQFVRDMNSQDFPQETRDNIVAAANDAFHGMLLFYRSN